jgi:hypothetical protein
VRLTHIFAQTKNGPAKPLRRPFVQTSNSLPSLFHSQIEFQHILQQPNRSYLKALVSKFLMLYNWLSMPGYSHVVEKVVAFSLGDILTQYPVLETLANADVVPTNQPFLFQ